MGPIQLQQQGYRWIVSSQQWRVYYDGKLIGEGSERTGKCAKPLARERRRQANRAAARDFARVDFVKRRVAGE